MLGKIIRKVQTLRHVDQQSAINSMNEVPLVSIIIPHFNRCRLLVETLASVYKQTHSNWEVIVVDDGSREEELSAVERLVDERVRVLIRKDGDKGPSRCRNLGAQAAKGTFLLFLDSDDLLAPWCLESRLQLFRNSNDVDAVILPVAIFCNTPGDTLQYWNDLNGDDDIARFVVSDPVWHTSSPMWRKASFQNIGGFNEKVMYGDDSELHLRSLFKKIRFRKCNQVLPDAFVRRADQERITGRISQTLIVSRRTRLAVGSDLIEEQGKPYLCRLWQSQYVDECEFLLFNAPGEQNACNLVLKEWHSRWPAYRNGQRIFRTYMKIGWSTIDRSRLPVRIARRVAMSLCPKHFYPERRPQQTRIDDSTALLLKKQLSINA